MEHKSWRDDLVAIAASAHDTDASSGIDAADNIIVVVRAEVFVAWSRGADCISPAIGVVAFDANAAAFASRATGVSIVFVGGDRIIDSTAGVEGPFSM